MMATVAILPPFETKGVTAPINSRDALVAKLKGRTIHIPNLTLMYQDWRGMTVPLINPAVDELRRRVKVLLNSLELSEEKVQRLEAADFAYCASLWWPEASIDRLMVPCCVALWLFVCDDELDEPNGAYADDYSRGQAYRSDTLKYAAISLGLLEDPNFTPWCRIMESFENIGAPLRAGYTKRQRQKVYDVVEQYLTGVQTEQRHRLTRNLPTLDEYLTFRMGSSAVLFTTSVGEYSLGTCLPKEIMESEAMDAIWNETNISIFVANDILSLRKELMADSVENMIPLIVALVDDADVAMAQCVNALKASKERFNQAAKEVLEMAKQYDCYDDAEKFIEVQKSNIVGNLVWSLETKRYKMAEVLNEDGSATFTV